MTIRIADVKNPQAAMTLRKIDAHDGKDTDGKGKGFDDVIDGSELLNACKGFNLSGCQDPAKAEALLRAHLGLETGASAGVEMIGNASLNLGTGKLYGYKGAEPGLSGNRMQVKYTSTENSGVTHDYDGGAWNGNPINLDSRSKLIIVVESGNIENTKFELNEKPILDYGQLKVGQNVIDLNALKEDSFSPMKSLKKFNFVNMPGAGEYIVRLILE